MGGLLALLAAALCLRARADFDGRWPRQIVSSVGLCRYGGRIDCCWGWARQSWGQCQPVCHPQCKHGDCVGPNKCKCHPGYAGKTCSQDERLFPTPLDQVREQPPYQPPDLQATSVPERDLNECGLKPRPCKHRCMNTFGSFKCYCLNGYMLMPDGSCSSALSCSMANCQYGCDVVKGQVRCQCPSPGLQLAPDGRTCVDVDECVTGAASCPRFRQCVNTFGSYICKCHEGFDLMYIGGKYQCHDIDECSQGQPPCSSFAWCHNTHGSYRCQCKEGYKGDGRTCVYVPKVMVEPPVHVPESNASIPREDGGFSNRIPDVGATQGPPETPYVPPVTTSSPTAAPTARPTPAPTPWHPPPPPPEPRTPPPPPPPTPRPTAAWTTAAPATTPSPWATVDNRIQTDPQKPRGDVFIPRQPSNDLFEIFEIERGISADEEAKDDPGVLVHSCDFDHGLCGWIREKDSDSHWELMRDPAGGQYLAVSAAKGPGSRAARLVLPLGRLRPGAALCLSFRHRVAGSPPGSLQVFVRKHGGSGTSVWGRAGGRGWRHTRVTLRGADVKSVIFRGERRRGHAGEVALDDVALSRGPCAEARGRHHM
ncbi:nephronectin isoform X3 [Sorex fumeus]|uniref:nephronectin isoform X3 n=1 Tax=Sorex fumeus TaxID=62283 RepID=UPI0024ACD722|nr:nephronectin isoform X3 [Sorex fumeus]